MENNQSVFVDIWPRSVEAIMCLPSDWEEGQLEELLYDCFHFLPHHEQEYYKGNRIPDCTTIAKAAEAGQLDFLKFCLESGYLKEFDSQTIGYALKGKKDNENKGLPTIKQEQVIEWLLNEPLLITKKEIFEQEIIRIKEEKLT